MASIADVYVTVIPETSKVAEGIKKAFREVDAEARRSGERWGREIKQGIGDVKVPVEPDTKKAKTELEKFRAEQERKKIRQQIEFDEGDFKKKMQLIGKEFDGVGGKLASAGKLNLGLTGIGLLPAAGTALANLAGTVQQLAGAGLVLPGVFAGIASSFGTAALGAHGMSDALKAITKASDGTKASVEAANTALAKLSPNAADTVKTVAGLKGTFDDLQHLDAQNLFAGVSEGLKGLVTNLLPATTRGIDGISRSLNQNLLQAMNSLGSGSSQGFLSRIFGNTANAQGQLTSAIDPIIHAFGTLASIGSDSLPRLATAVGHLADRFNMFITAAASDGKLSKWINDGISGFTNLGNIALNLGKSFTAITQAAGGSGGLLPMLQNATERLQVFLNSSAGQNKLTEFFAQGRDMLGQLKDVAVQLGPILSGVFQSGLSSANLWLPVIREILSDINSIPGGAQAVVTAFVAWNTISGVASLASSLNGIINLLKVALPAASAEGAAGMTTAFTGVAATISKAFAAIALPATLLEAMHFQQTHAAADDAANGRTKTLPIGPRGMGVAVNPNTLRDPNAPTSNLNMNHPLGVPIPDPNRNRYGWNGVNPLAAPGTPGAAPPPAFQWGAAPVPVPAVSSYVPPVITQAPSGTPNLPYAGTADPYAMSSGYTSDAALLANVPAGSYSQTSSADLTKGLGDCSSAVEDLVNLMQGNSTAGRSMSTGNAPEWLAAHGFVPGSAPGAFNVGFNNEHMQATLPGGTPFNWGSNAAAARGGVGGTGAFDPAFTQHYYLPTSGNPASSAAGGGLTGSDLSLRNANQRVADTQHTEEQSQARLNELRAKGTATDRQMEAAEYALAKAKREHQDAIDGLTVAQDKYNKSSAQGQDGKDSGGSGLGNDLMGGIAQFFGFDGSLFKNPADFGIMKFITGAANLKFKKDADGGSTPVGSPGGLGGLLGMAQSFMPGMPGGNSLNIVDAAQFSQTGGPGSPGPGNNPAPGYQNSGIDMRGAQLGVNPGDLTNQLSTVTASQNRWAPLQQNLPH